VVREGHVPVLRLSFDDPADYELRFLQLGGRGIRSLARVDRGFLVLARPEHDRPDDNVIYFWNGLDHITLDGGSPGRVEQLTRIDAPRGGTPEAICVAAKHDTSYEILVLYDGIPQGHPLRMRIPHPGQVQSAR
jgi:hypothetical protein